MGHIPPNGEPELAGGACANEQQLLVGAVEKDSRDINERSADLARKTKTGVHGSLLCDSTADAMNTPVV